MADIPETTKARARQLAGVSAGADTDFNRAWPKAFTLFITDVSDLAKVVDEALGQAGYLLGGHGLRARVRALVLPDEPEKLDELAEVLAAELAHFPDTTKLAVNIRHQLSKRGLKIVADQ